jgi:hypothetical protein
LSIHELPTKTGERGRSDWLVEAGYGALALPPRSLRGVIESDSARVFAYLDFTGVRWVLEQERARRNRGGS